MKLPCLISGSIFLLIISADVSAQQTIIRGANIYTAEYIGKSKPVRELKKDKGPGIFYRKEVENETLEAQSPIIYKPVSKNIADQALQKNYNTDSTTINLISNWEGLSENVDPSDNTLAVSANYVVQLTNNWSNSAMNIWDKSGNLIAEEINTGDISGFDDYGDPNIIYDRQADRFIFCCLDPGFGSRLVLCISETGDPTGSWLGYRLNFPEGFPDYPKIAVWDDCYVLTTNSNTPSIWAIRREQMLSGEAAVDIQEFNLDRFGSIGFQSASPITQTGATPPAENSPFPIIRVADDAWSGVDTDHLELFFVDIDWDDASLSEMEGPFNLNTIDYDSRLCGFDSWECIPQPGTSQKLDPLGNIVMDKVQYLNFLTHETIICSHVCKAYEDGYAGIRWYELRRNPGEENYFIYQQGTFAPNDSNYRFMSSITMNEEGTIGMGYNLSSETTYPSIGITGKSDCDSNGVMGASEIIAQSGSKANSINRYGDYNNIVSDPLDGSFWLTANYNQTSSWKTRVIHFSIDKCLPYIPGDPNQQFADLMIMPVPADQTVQISFNSALDGSFNLLVYDMLGQVVISQDYNLVKGNNSIELNVITLASGNYLLQLISEQNDVTKQFNVQH